MNREDWYLPTDEERAVIERLRALTLDELRGVIDRTTDPEQLRQLQAEYRSRRICSSVTRAGGRVSAN
jgi:hypothetical protein